MRREETRDALVKVDDGAVTVDFKNTGKAATGVVARVKRAHKRAMKKLKKKVDKTVSGLTNYGEGNSRAPTFRAGYQSPGGWFRDRGGLRVLRPSAVDLLPRGVGGDPRRGVRAREGVRDHPPGRRRRRRRPAASVPLPGFGGAEAETAPGLGAGRWVKDRTLGGREIWVEDKYRASPRRNFGGAMDSLAEPTYSGGLSERAANERKAAEAKERRQAKVLEDAAEPRWWDPPSPGYCPESQREQRLLAARAVYAALSNKRVSGLQYNEGDPRRCEKRVPRRGLPSRIASSRRAPGRAFMSAVEFATTPAARRSSTASSGCPRSFSRASPTTWGSSPVKPVGSSPPPSPRGREPSCSKPARSFDGTSRAPR